MLRSNTHSLSDLVKLYKRKHNLEPGLQKTRIYQAWPNVVGTLIARKSKIIDIRKRVLHVHIESSVIRNELVMLKQDIIRRLNEEAKGDAIDDIFFR